MKIAYIEDSEADFIVFKAAMFGCDVDRYKEVEEFVDGDYDIIVSDLSLVKTFGVETIKELREKTDKKIVVLTGLAKEYMSGRDYARFLEVGATDVFQKCIVPQRGFKGRLLELIEEK